jgi:hypothetical protein
MVTEKAEVKDRFNISLGKDTYLLLLKARHMLEEKEGKGVSFAKTIRKALELLLELEEGEKK